MAFNVQQLPLKLLSEISFQIETEGAKVLTGFSNALRLEMIKNAKSVPLSKNPWYVTPNENAICPSIKKNTEKSQTC